MEEIHKSSKNRLEPVTLPHDWSVQFPFEEGADTLGAGGYVRAGKGWYKKIFKVAEISEDQQVLLQFDGVYMNSKVWLNGKLLGGHIYGYTPFSFSIRELLKPCDYNELIVFVDNSAQPNSRWYSGSGITRPVWIYRENIIHISREDLFIYTKNVDINKNTATVEFSGTVTAANLHKLPRMDRILVTWQIIDQAGHACCSRELYPKFEPVLGDRNVIDSENSQKAGFKVSETLVQVDLWEPDTPHLYELSLKLYKMDDNKNTTLIDEKCQQFGVRTADFDPSKGFLLNGRSVKLNGVCLHHDGGCVGAAVPEKIWERRLTKLKAMGCNSIRFSRNPPDPQLLSLCDRMGYLVMAEAFDEWEITKQKEWGSNTHESLGYSKWFDQCSEQDLRTMLLRDRNHPCIILWSIGNEVPEQLTKNGWVAWPGGGALR